MAQSILDPKTGFDQATKVFHSLRPPLDLPPEDALLSASEFALSLRLTSPWPDSVAIIDSDSGYHLSHSEFVARVRNLSAHIQKVIGLSKGDPAFILSPNAMQVPILYFSLLSLGVIVSPANPVSTVSDISRQVSLSQPVIAFTTSETAHKIPTGIRYGTVLIDSPEFESMMKDSSALRLDPVDVTQSDVAAIMYSSGTTGNVKGVMWSHRNLTALIASNHRGAPKREKPAILFFTVPYFHAYGFFFSLKSVALSETSVITKRVRLEGMFRSIEQYAVTHLAASPPVVVAIIKGLAGDRYNLGSLELVVCGGGPLGKDVIAAFAAKFPSIVLLQGYGMTETTGAVSIPASPEETRRWGAAGKLAVNFQAKLVDPDSGEALPPGQQGELWVRGPTIMKGYVGDEASTLAAFGPDGWLRTGDLCYIDGDGFVYVMDRLKEIIKFKGGAGRVRTVTSIPPPIADAAVIPYPDEEAGEVPLAFVVRLPESNLDADQVMEFVNKQVAPYKKIRRVVFETSIPRNAAGKILRKKLKEMALSFKSKL